MSQNFGIMSKEEVQAKLEKLRGPELGYTAMYSSYLGGVVTDPSLMMIPIDEHMVHRGHAVFDTATLYDGKLFQLDSHLDRFFRSAEAARITPPYTREELIDIILRVCAISGQRNGALRYWMTAGPGNFGISPDGCQSCFYLMIFSRFPVPPTLKGIHERTIKDVPLKPKLLANLKSNNYLLNCLTCMSSRDKGGEFGILIDEAGNVAETCIGNVLSLSSDKVLRTPPFDKILRGTTINLVFEVAVPKLIEEGLIKAAFIENIAESDLHKSVEILLMGGDTHFFPVINLDGHAIGDGEVGPISKRIKEIMQEYMESGTTRHHIPVDYSDN
eukprot:NODE_3353_length_1367_cov_6.040997_g2917_i0.p1 GENE.NODE_3353_length_1367_cov_6.040997_g2917_i0~~NODE_3353_length_1367_cov_6.040997_g2917_i0.p1  ORF type:complete len:330 (-),score=50.54 NODE_3353_length_1367_cov_6.040997_g2917_i0:319-1308(-)